MGQRKKELIALKACGLRKGGKPAKNGARIAKIKDDKSIIIPYDRIVIDPEQSKLFIGLLNK